MGIERTRVTGCFDMREWQHILTVAMSEQPNLTMSKALCRIVRQHRLWHEARQYLSHLPRVTAEQIVAAENEPVSQPQKASGGTFLAQERKRA